MLVTTWKTRIRYAETDQMGYCYYGNYPVFFEMGRVEALRSIGIRYRDLEEQGVMLPVAHLEISYKKPVRYDEEITIETTIPEYPSGTRLPFDYKIFNESGELTTTGRAVLVFALTESGRPCAAPAGVLEALKPHFM
ncbi:MAG: thioesterase [Cryomorphaceae bacterium BACL7 MAG-120910-bin2]|jgi:acyl-CoA thioester hydrolase|nr:MAG: thioesterase [Cryomorphaceae bacterium BACL7 MAG-120910-bin2]KRO69263.1 MAG: thioesterase [Cryomorphaceae bacterium BACL7 MAG-120322-bin74]KRO82142.1 MAG: thioesterase [Cryomorphaceae bacterium BACL7 MAG-121220-bin83]NQW25044.1 acyl-CoA thioesterase [Cryomorphaceae bacterium]